MWKSKETQHMVTSAMALFIHPIDNSLDDEGIKDSNPDADIDTTSSDNIILIKPSNMPPCLKEIIPVEFFPDILIVKDAAGRIIRYHSSSSTPDADKVPALLETS